MKTGKSLMDLAAEIVRRSEAKADYVVQTRALRMVPELPTVENAPPLVALEFGDRHVGINEVAHGQLADHVAIPTKYYDRMRAEAPALLASNVNHWLEANPGERMVRTMDGRARAFLSDKYRPMENESLAEAIFPVLNDLQVEIMSADITDRKFYIKAVDRRILADVPAGKRIGDGSHTFFDTLSPAITIANSEVGLGALSVETSIFTKVCTNLATISRAGSVRKHHVGSRHELGGEDIYRMLSDTTRRLDDAALWSRVRDVVRTAFNEAAFRALVDERIKGMVDQPITGDPVRAVDLAAKRLGVGETEKASVLRHLITGGDLTRYGLFNAVTRAAEDLESYDRATEFERLGGMVIELPANDWRAIAEAA